MSDILMKEISTHSVDKLVSSSEKDRTLREFLDSKMGLSHLSQIYNIREPIKAFCEFLDIFYKNNNALIISIRRDNADMFKRCRPVVDFEAFLSLIRLGCCNIVRSVLSMVEWKPYKGNLPSDLLFSCTSSSEAEMYDIIIPELLNWKDELLKLRKNKSILAPSLVRYAAIGDKKPLELVCKLLDIDAEALITDKTEDYISYVLLSQNLSFTKRVMDILGKKEISSLKDIDLTDPVVRYITGTISYEEAQTLVVKKREEDIRKITSMCVRK